MSLEATDTFLEDVTKAWMDIPLKHDFLFPWESEGWKPIFGNPTELCKPLESDFKRPWIAAIPDSCPEPSSYKRPKTSCDPPRSWVDIIRPGVDELWMDKKEADVQVALKRWLGAVMSFPDSVALGKLIRAQPTIQLRLKMIKNLLWKKSPHTLAKRINSLNRYLMYLQDHSVLFPGTEELFYDFLVKQQLAEVPESKLQGVMEAMKFTEHVLGVPEISLITTSKRCCGAASAKKSGPKRQADPFKVIELLAFHEVVSNADSDTWDRLFAGTVLCMVYSRSRWNDLQHAESVLVDRDDTGKAVFIEFTIDDHKCSSSAVFRNTFLHAVAPCIGVSDNLWVESWLECRDELGISFDLKHPTMPAPDSVGKPTMRPLSTDEMKQWVAALLGRFGLLAEGRRLTSHSCKCTLLSWASKFGIAWDDRLVLGGHVGHLRSAITYSRDAMSRPLQMVEEMLTAIRRGTFKPDETRSGRFVAEASTESQHDAVPFHSDLHAEPSREPDGIVKDEVGADNLNGGEVPIVVDSSPSEFDSEDVGTTSTSSDEEAGAFSGTKRLVNLPKAPEGHRLIQHVKLKTLHLIPSRTSPNLLLVCGRKINDNYTVADTKVRWDTPCCHLC